VKRQAKLVALSGVALALVASGCSSNTGNDSDGAKDHTESSTDIIGTAEDSKGPASAIDGAKEGGEITILGRDDLVHLDPARAYVSSYMMVGGGLLWRSLTGYREEMDGTVKLVGDLATDPGTDVNGDCTVWEYTLKDGLKYEDGSDITAEDVAYGVARSFYSKIGDGPQFLQDWLDPERKYEGPYDGGEKIPPGVAVDGKKITFTFSQARCETPFAVALGTTSPVPEAEDKGEKYDDRPFSSGPYKIADRTLGEKLTLERNEHWDAKTDPLRNAYPDTYSFEWGFDTKDIANRIEANQSGDENVMTLGSIHPEVLPNILADKKSYGDRLITAPQKYNAYMAIHTEHITDVDQRRALNHAFPRDRYMQMTGGTDANSPSTTLMAPTVPGWKEYDAYPYDVDKAKELLGGESLKIRYAYPETPLEGKIADMLVEEYGKAGIEVEAVPIPTADYYGQIAVRSNDFDLYWASWGQDWPSGSTVIAPVWGEDGLADEGGSNYSFFTAPEIEKRIDEIEAMPVSEGLPLWAELDETIMKDYAPSIPISYSIGNWITGSDIGGLYISQDISTIDVRKLFLKS